MLPAALKSVLVCACISQSPETRTLPAWDLPTLPGLMAQLHRKRSWGDSVLAGKFAKIGEPAVAPLIAALADKDENVRRGAAHALGTMAERRAVAPISDLLTDASEDVRAAAAWSLGAIRDRSVVPRLVKALGDPSPYVGLRAANALGWLRDSRATDALMKCIRPRTRIANDAARALGRIGDERAVALLVGVLGEDRMHCVASEGIGALALGDNAAEALGQIGKAAAPALIAALRSKDEWVRERAAVALRLIRSPDAIDSLLPLLTDRYPMVQLAAAEALAENNETRAVPTLLVWLTENPDGAHYRTAVDCLGKIGDERALGPLMKIAREAEHRLREDAIHAIGGIHGDRSFAFLSDMLKREIQPNAALAALARQRDPRAFALMVDRMRAHGDTDDVELSQAFSAYGDSRAVPLLLEYARKSEKGRYSYLSALFHVGDPGRNALVEVLRAREEPLLEKTIWVVEHSADARFVVPLRALGSHPNAGLAASARLAALQIDKDTR